MKRKLLWAAALAYLALMLWMMLDRQRCDPALSYWSQLRDHLNLIPFRTNWQYVLLLDGHAGWGQWKHAVICLFGNILTFLPLGAFLPTLFPRCHKLSRTLLWGGTGVICVELIQLFTLTGSCDIDDLLLNLLGMTVGYALWALHDTANNDSSGA